MSSSMENVYDKSEEDLTQMEPKTDSFWDIGNYKRVVKRMDDGAKLCSEFVKMAQERAEIEAKYVKGLQQWARRWEDSISKGPEYGSLEVGWKAVLKEATRMSETYVDIHRKILNDIIESVNAWKSQNYHRSMLHFKECKKVEDGFFKSQKPWAKKLGKSNRARKAYHHAAKELEMQTNSLQLAENNPDYSMEQCGKVREKRDRAQKDMDKVLAKYKERLSDLQHYQSRYIEDMNAQFEKCQEFEQGRMEFFKRTLLRLKDTLDISKDPRVVDTYEEFANTLEHISSEEDLKWYSVNYGTDMSYNWPEFEGYVMEQQSFSIRQTSTFSNSSPSVSGMANGHSGPLQRIRRPEHSSRNSMQGGGAGSSGSGSSSPAPQQRRDSRSDEGEEDWIDPPSLPPPNKGNTINNKPEAKDDEEEEEDEKREASREAKNEEEAESEKEEEEEEEDDGILMRALYDYDGPEEDDLSFREGDMVRIVHKGEDGWAHGVLQDKYGYVPFSYFEPM